MGKKEEKTEKPQCVTEGCDGVSVTRGLCQKCYSAACQAVKKGTATWDQLVQFGLAREATRKSGASSLFRSHLAAELAKRGKDVECKGTKGNLPWAPGGKEDPAP